MVQSAILAVLLIGTSSFQANRTRVKDISFQLPAGWSVKANNASYPTFTKGGIEAARIGIFGSNDYQTSFETVVADVSRRNPNLDESLRIFGPAIVSGPQGRIATYTTFQQELKNSKSILRGTSTVIADFGKKYVRFEVSYSTYETYLEQKPGIEAFAKSIRIEDSSNAPTKPTTAGPITKAMVDSAPEGLPAPTFPYSQNTDNCVRELVKRLNEPSGSSLADFLLAVQNSGFFVADSTGKVVQRPAWGTGIGVRLTALEAINYSRLQESGFRVNLKRHFAAMSEGFSVAGVKPDCLSLVRTLVKNGLDSKNDSYYFLSKLVIELGKNQSPSFDITSDSIPDNATLDAFQSLVLTRFLLTAFLAAPRLNSKGTCFGTLETPGFLLDPIVNQSSQVGPETAIAQQTSWIEDASVNTIVSGLGQALGKILESYETNRLSAGNITPSVLEKYGGKYVAWAGLINIVGMCLKFYSYYACLDAEFSPNPVVERTKNKSPGKSADVDVTFSVNPPKLLQVLKDIRVAVAPLGVDIDMPSAGPMAGSLIEWSLPETNRTTISDQIVTLSTGDGGTFRKLILDDKGHSKITLTGVPQNEDLTGLPVSPWNRPVLLRATATIKGPNFRQDSVDTLNFAINFPTGQLATALNFVLEMFYREPLIAPKATKVWVTDWTKAKLKFTGSISVSGSATVEVTKSRVEYKHNQIKISRDAGMNEVSLFPKPLTDSGVFFDILKNVPASEAGDWESYETLNGRQVPIQFSFVDEEIIDERGRACASEDYMLKSNQLWTDSGTDKVGNVALLINYKAKKYYLWFIGPSQFGSVTQSGTMTVQDFTARPSVSKTTKIGPYTTMTNIFDQVKGVTDVKLNSYSYILEGTIPTKPDGSLGQIEGTAEYKGIARWCPVTIKYSWQIGSQ